MTQSIAYLGPRGTFCEQAAQHIFPTGSLVPYQNVTAVIEDVHQGTIVTAVLPMENLLEGTVTPVLDGLTRFPEVKICGEYILPISHHLLTVPGMTINNITAVLSHSHALAQCQVFLQQKLPAVAVHAVSSTAEAARQVALELHDCAAIGNDMAARLYGLNILEANIGDERENYTRFVVVGKEISPPTGQDKTSIAFVVHHRPGSLAEMLNIFAIANINLTKIESRPSRKALGEYIFYVDFEGHMAEPRVKATLKRVEDTVAYLNIMGSYPRFR